MEEINELVELAQQIDAVIDDANHQVSGLTISLHGTIAYQVSPEYFLKHFTHFDANRRDSSLYPIDLRTEIEGVSFEALVSVRDLGILDGRVPADWLARFNPATQQANSVSSICTEAPKSGHTKSPLAQPCEDGQLEQTFYPHYA